MFRTLTGRKLRFLEMSCQIVIDLFRNLHEAQIKDLKLVDSCNTTFGKITINNAAISMMENQMLPTQTAIQNHWNKRKRFSSPMPRAKRHVTNLPIQRMPPIQAMRSSFRQQIPNFQQSFTPQTYTMLPPRVPPSVAPVLSMSTFYSKVEVDDDVIEIEKKDGILPPPVANLNNASSNEVITRQVPVVQNNPAVPLQILSPVGPQNAGPHPSTPAQNESLMSGIHTQTVTPQTGGQQQQPNGNQIQNRPQPGIAIVRPQSVEQATESSNATTSPPLEPVVVEKQVNMSPVFVEGSNSTTHHQITSQVVAMPSVTSVVATVQSNRSLLPSSLINATISDTESKQPVNNSISSTSNHTFLNMASHLNKSFENTNTGTRTMMNGCSTSNNPMTESSNSSNDRRNSNSVALDGSVVMDLTNPTKATAANATTGVNEHQQQQQTPNLMPVQMTTNPPATNTSFTPDARETG